MAPQDIRVTVWSADPLTLAGALSHLRHEPGIELVESSSGDSAARSGAAAVAVVLTQQFDEATVSQVRKLVREPAWRVVLVTDRLREPELLAVLECGVRAILWRTEATPARLVRVIRVAARGESQLPAELLGQLISHVGRTQRAAAYGPSLALQAIGLATREIDVLKLLAEGLDTREIAEKLAYSERTIKNVLYGLTTRLQLRNRVHAVAYALREGYI
ncbi:response regulator transcription factor [Pseudonocardia adelaidensis]|uniref:Response regulator transcription factor n=1 Tax=Pseudonocardia adelaidensis TaxID=648754 RepID=A0ABP9P8W6_9PSEU